jgi:prevent-host-death family protein
LETVNISELRANLLNYLNKAKEGHEIFITSHGETLATIVPPIDRKKQAKARLKLLAKGAVLKDLISPIDEKWDAH